jgi:ribonuclease R
MGKKDHKNTKPGKQSKNAKAGKRMSKKQLSAALEQLFSSNPDKALTLKEIFRTLRLNTHPLKMLAMDILEEMAWDDFVTKTSDTSYQLNTKGQVQEGTFIRKSNGKNSFQPDDGGKPIFVAERNSMSALSGDRVRVSFMARRRNHIKEAQVIAILQRAKDRFVGRLRVDKDIAFLVTPENTFAQNILIPKNKLKGGKTDDKAVVKITRWPDEEHKSIVGEVVDVLGKRRQRRGDEHHLWRNTVCLISIRSAWRMPPRRFRARSRLQDVAEREDFRDTWTCTIDPKLMPRTLTMTHCRSSNSTKDSIRWVCILPMSRTMSPRGVSLTVRPRSVPRRSISSTARYRCCRSAFATLFVRCAPMRTS